MAKKLEKLSAALGSALKARGLQARLAEYRIIVQWERAVGRAIARHAQPRVLRGGKLYLAVDSPAWMQQLSLMKPEIIEKLNGCLGKNTVKDLALNVGEVVFPENRLEEAAPRRMPLGAEEREKIEQYVRDIPDHEVREALRRVIEKDFQSRKSGRL